MARRPGEKERRKKPAGETVQTAVRLPRHLLERLRESDYGITGGIKRGVELMLQEATLGEATRDLMLAISQIAAEIELETGCSWDCHVGAHTAFRQAILSRLARLKPEGSAAFGMRPHQTGPQTDPQAIGIWAEHAVWEARTWSPESRARFREAQEKTFQEIIALQKHRNGDES
jgi:hypothetical protein